MIKKNIVNWIIIIIISSALIITTIATNLTTKNEKIIYINSFKLYKEELNTITQNIQIIYPKINKINDFQNSLEKKIIKHISNNIIAKKLGIVCTKEEVLYQIINANSFKKQNLFSVDLYTKYLQKQKITENIFQKKIKQKSENDQIKFFLKKRIKQKNTIIKNTPDNKFINKITYSILSKKNLMNKINIDSYSYTQFEKENIKKYIIPDIYKIKYLSKNKNNTSKNSITTTVSNNEINYKIFYLIKQNKNNKLISIKNKTTTFIIKKIKKINQKINKNIYKENLLNQYKKNILATFIKKNNYSNIKLKNKTKFISPKCKKTHLTNLLKKSIKIKTNKININKSDILIIKKILKKKSNLQIPIDKKFKYLKNIKNKIKNKNFNKNQTYLLF